MEYAEQNGYDMKFKVVYSLDSDSILHQYVMWKPSKLPKIPTTKLDNTESQEK
jgi:hypothetical protein